MTIAMVLAFVLTGTAANTYIEDSEAPASFSFVEDAVSSVDNLNLLSAVLDASEAGLSFGDFSLNTNNFLLECECDDPDAAPVLSIESETFNLVCGDVIPPPPSVTVIDECDTDLGIQTFVIGAEVASQLSDCNAFDAIGDNADYWAIWLPVLNQFTDQWRFTPGDGGSYVEYDNNTAIITGLVQSIENPARKFRLHITLEGNYDWTTWNSMMTIGNPQVNRTYKDTYGFGAMDNNFMDWSYYTIDPDNSFMIGEDAFEGAYLLLKQAPSNLLFGAQVGLGANDTNGNYGVASWFTYTGYIPDAAGDLIYTEGQGDINIDIECGPPTLTTCDAATTSYTFIAVNSCGNSDTETLTYIIAADETGPVFDSCPADVEVECGNVPEVPTLTATDDCNDVLSIDFFEQTVAGSCDQAMTINRVWTATDGCGNTTFCEQTISVVDTTAPEFNETPEDMTVECDQPTPTAPDLTATDLCDTDVVITMTSSITNDVDCPTLEVITRNWVATDDCGNSVSVGQTITIQDTTPPSISCPADATVECGTSSDPSVTGEAQGSDACGATSISYVDGPESGSCPVTFTRTWTATDDCGNSSTCDQQISIADTTAPVMTGGSSGTANVECDEALPTVEAPTASDVCSGAITVDANVEESDDNACAGSVIYTWTATDDCGNSSVQTFTILIQDTTAPEITCPANATYACEDEVPDLVVPSATDNCDEDVSVECFEINLGEEGSALCDLDNPSIPGPGQNWSIYLPALPNGVSSNFVWDAAGATMYVFGNELFITGHVVNVNDPSYGFTVNIKANNMVDWAGWNGQLTTMNPFINRLYKDDYGHAAAGGNLWTTWDFYEINPIGSNLIGTGGFAGSNLSMTHAPNNYLYGLQVGESANNKSTGYGLASWFTLNGTINGNSYSGQGDISSDADCDNPFTPCSYQILRVCTATDDCGNGATCAQIITITDDVAPTIECPADVTIECTESSDPATTGMATGEDNCGEVTITYLDGPITGTCPASFSRAWTATDECENTATCVQVISIDDTTPPVLTINPDATVECGDAFDLAGASATDNCDVEVTIESDSAFVADCGDTGVWTITYTATDDCDNTTTAAQTITIVDTTSPVITPMPLEITAECDNIPAAADGEATDVCGSVDIVLVETGYSGGCQGAIERTYTATDACGNTSTFIQLVNIIDTTPPTITVAEDETLECTEAVPEASAEASDNCGDATWTVSETTEDMCGVTYTLTRVYTATDECGNTAQDTQVITVVDTTPPTFEGVPTNTTAECDDIDRSDVVDALDNCDGPIPFDYEEFISNEVCVGTYTLTRVWSAMDACGNTATASQVIEVSDTTAPDFDSVPADVTVECDEVPVAVEPATATDNCDPSPTVTSEDMETPGPCMGSYTIFRTYTATDDCGNSSSYTQTITVVDTTSPEFVGGVAFLTVECDDLPDPDDIETTDNCGTVTVTVDDSGFSGGCQGAIQRTYTATDDCGNTATFIQIINVVDTTDPIITPNPDATVECTEAFDLAGATATDNCDDDVSIESDSSFVATCGDAGVWTITYTATDDCDNSATATQTITIVDTTAPTVTANPDATVECGDAFDLAGATGSDTCGEVTIESDSAFVADCGDTGVWTITYTATDDCDNTATATQTITIVDTTAPSITCPDDYTGECDDNTSVATLGAATGSDACGAVEITWANVVEPGCGGSSTIYRTFTATDDCGNTATCTQTIIKLDTTPPVISGLEPFITAECDDIPEPDEATVTDNCSETTLTTVDSGFSGGCQGAIERVYTATDECGNSSTYTQIINVVDTTPPTITCPADATAECGSSTSVDVYGIATGSDTCGEVEITWSNTSEPTCGETFVISRLFTATDECGNTSTCTQTITVVDTTPPTITAADDATVECTDELPAPDASAADSCGDATWEVTAESTPGCGDTFVMVRTYTATDDCGNTATDTQTITVVDTTAPSITANPDATVECGDAFDLAGATGSDTCGEVTIESDSAFVADCGDTGVWTITYTATDDCDNTATATQTITIVDTTSPVITPMPLEITAECDDIPAAAEGEATDVCGTATVTMVETGFSGGCQGALQRTYTATDECGNTSTFIQVVNIVDTTDPVITANPDATVECTEPFDLAGATATDNCTDPTIESDSTFVAGCGNTGVWTITYTATDDCDNTATATQTITIVDTTAPSISANPDATVECGDAFDLAGATGSDTCGEVTIESDSAFVADCGNTGVWTITYTATDDCDNTATATQTITIVDTTAPSITCPDDYTGECDDNTSVATLGAATGSDACGAVEITWANVVEPGCGGSSTIYRTFTATDECGLTATCTQTIIKLDTTPPVITGLEPFITAECDDIPEPDEATVTDNCSETTLTIVDAGFSGGCQGAIERVYTATDECGNSSTYTQIINVVDTTPPTITCPADATAECGSNTSVAVYGIATGSDTCGEVEITWSNETELTCGETSVISRLFTATDECGNTSTCTQTITVVDTTPPTLTIADDATVECTDELPAPDASAADSCGDATWEVTAESTPGCGNTFVMVRTYTATDDCGNTTTDTQTITVVDTTAPSITANPDATVECGDAFDLAGATGSDTCGEVTIESDSAFVADCGNTGVWTITYTATDECDNTATATQTITIVDTTSPAFGDIEAFITAECDNVPGPDDVEATDACGTASVSVSDSGFSGGCQGAIERTYTATDECDNTATFIQIINVVDTTDPAITANPDATVECTDVFDLAGATATDNCDDDVSIESDSSFVSTCGDAGVWTITYTATDDCNNSATATQTITIVDTTAPSISANPDATVECGDAFDLAGATGSDTCGEVTIESDSAFVADCGDTGVWTIMYTATDDCGNTATASQTITIVDTTAPSITANPDATVECGDAFDLAGATGSDTCGEVTIESDSAFVADCGDTGVWTITYTATDDCDNTATATQTITIVDTTPPVIVGLDAFITAECDNIPGPDDATATDNCGTVTFTVVDAGFSGGCQGAIERVYTATDECGNTSIFTQIVNVVDTTPPTLSVNPDATVECGDDFDLAGATATDNCDDDVTIESDSSFVAACGNSGVWTITYTATDECNNTATAAQVITIVDTTDPTFDNAPGDVTVDCQQVPAPADVTASDNCGDATVSMTETATGGCPYTITRTYTATDACNNSAVHVQVITVVDTTAPVLSSMPADATVECDNIPAADVLTATDNCDDVTVDASEETIGSGCSYSIERTWSATDACGNSTSYTQTLTVVDTTSPEFDAASVPSDTSVECDAIPAPSTPTATDNCSTDITIMMAESEVMGSCDGEKTITRTWTANDGCDNTATVSQTITVTDTTAPVLSANPADETYTCGDEIPDAPAVTATDNCSEVVSVVFEETTVGNTNPNLDCALTTGEPSDALANDQVWSMFLEEGGVRDYFILDENGAQFTELPLGGGEFEAHITGTLVDADDASEAWMMDVWLIQKTDYDGWTGQLTLGNPAVPRQAKTFNGVAEPGDAFDWDFWILDGSRSQLIGINSYAGDILALDHAPSNLLFAFEVGMQANNYSEGFGIGGWFSYSGTINGVASSGQGDFAFSAECPPCEYVITRTWTATDNCGNSVSTTQIITVNAQPNLQEGDDDVLGAIADVAYGFVSTYPNPTGNMATLVYRVPADTEVMIEVMSGTGKAISSIYNGAALSGTENYAQFDGSNLNNGVYVVRLTTDNNVFYQKVVLSK